jgi:aminoglycoside phosphotransferase family enzyme/predicted kinase
MSLPAHIEWLRDHAPGVDAGVPAEIVQTHISFVVLAADRVYKVKKAVNFGFLDFTTLDDRCRMCEAEVRLNSRLSPDVYVCVEAIRRDGDAFALGDGKGEVVDYAVVMRRLPADGMLDAMLAGGRAEASNARAIADVVARFHLEAERGGAISEFGARAAIEHNWTENFEQTASAVPEYLDVAAYARLRAYVGVFLDGHEDLLARRREQGWIRDGHGDLKTTAIAFEDPAAPAETVRILDCIEFNDRMRYGDVANDLAFLLMDLESRGRPDLADEVLARYLSVTLDGELPLLLPFYECYRAYVIAKISTFAAADEQVPRADREAAAEIARRHFQLAGSYAGRTGAAQLVVVCGPSGSGKSTLATALTGRLGARWLSSDLVRKGLAGIDARSSSSSRLDDGLYDAGSTARTYTALFEEAGVSLGRGESVVLDATFSDPAQRAAAAVLGGRHGVALDFLVCDAAEDVVRERLRARAEDAAAVSEGTWEVYLSQRDRFAGIVSSGSARLQRIDTGGALQQSVPAALAALGQA